MKILITGATGLVGSGLGPRLVEAGHTLVVVSRNRLKALENLTFTAEVIEWDLTARPLPEASFAGVGAIINLAGESLDGHWSSAKKKSILDSRKNSSRHLVANCPATVKTIISVSASGFYGDRGEENLTENSAPGKGFLPEVCQEWEAPFKNLSQRTVILRLGIVLSKKGGALKKLVGLFQKNLGARLGSGRQWMSYVSLDDLTRLIGEAVENEKFVGVFNVSNNHPVRNSEFTETLSQQLQVGFHLPPAPAFVLKGVLGEMSQLVLASIKMRPERLNELGFVFHDGSLKAILDRELHVTKNQYSQFYAEQFIPYDVEQVFDFFANHENLEKITPTLLNFQTEKISTARVEKDTLIDYKLKIRGFPLRWRTLIKSWNRPFEFVDTQLKGPYTYWRHTHRFQRVKNGTLMTDEVQYKVPLGALGRLVAGSFVAADVEKIFAFRRKVIAQNNFNE